MKAIYTQNQVFITYEALSDGKLSIYKCTLAHNGATKEQLKDRVEVKLKSIIVDLMCDYLQNRWATYTAIKNYDKAKMIEDMKNIVIELKHFPLRKIADFYIKDERWGQITPKSKSCWIGIMNNLHEFITENKLNLK